MATGVQVWSQTAATNATADSNVNWAEGMAPSAVNDSARAEMSSVAKWRDDNASSLITSGSSSAFTLATNQVATALTSGYTVAFQFHTVNDSSATLNVDGLGAKPLQSYAGNNVLTNTYQANSRGSFTYSSTGTGQWIATNPPAHTFLQNAIQADVILSTSYTTNGPTIAQGTVGSWYVHGFALFNNTTATPGVTVSARLNDGTNTYASASAQSATTGQYLGVSVAALVTSPVGSITLQALGSVTGVTMRTSDSVADGTNCSRVMGIRIA